MPGHSHSVLCWQGLQCRVLDLSWAGCIRCCVRRLAPLNCCHTFSGRGSSDSADQFHCSPPTTSGRHHHSPFNSTSKQGATSGESAVADAKWGAHLVWQTQEACPAGFRGSNPPQPPHSPPPSLRPLEGHHPTSHGGCAYRTNRSHPPVPFWQQKTGYELGTL